MLIACVNAYDGVAFFYQKSYFVGTKPTVQMTKSKFQTSSQVAFKQINRLPEKKTFWEWFWMSCV